MFATTGSGSRKVDHEVLADINGLDLDNTLHHHRLLSVQDLSASLSVNIVLLLPTSFISAGLLMPSFLL